jgi:hypothetical protein
MHTEAVEDDEVVAVPRGPGLGQNFKECPKVVFSWMTRWRISLGLSSDIPTTEIPPNSTAAEPEQAGLKPHIIVFATSDLVSHHWITDLLLQKQPGPDTTANLLERVVPGRAFAAEISRKVNMANTLYIVERANEKGFEPRNPISGYSELLRTFFYEENLARRRRRHQ